MSTDGRSGAVSGNAKGICPTGESTRVAGTAIDSDLQAITGQGYLAKRRRLSTKTTVRRCEGTGDKRPREATASSERFERLRQRVLAKEQARKERETSRG